MASACTITIEVGGIAICVRTLDRGFAALLENHYAKFQSAAARPKVKLDVELMEANAAAGGSDVRVWNEGGTWHLSRGDFRAEYVPRRACGRARLRPTLYSMDSVLRILHTLLLAREGGFLLHAAGVIGQDRALLFSGVSGAGKTTLSRLAPSTVTLLTDEISYVRRDGSGYRAFGTPFAGELGRTGENTSALLGAVYLLAKGRKDHTRDIAPARAARALMRNLLFFAQDRELVHNVFATVCDLVAGVPVRQLTFAPTPRVWELIQQEAW